MFFFGKILRALFLWNTRFEICPCVLLPTISQKVYIHAYIKFIYRRKQSYNFTIMANIVGIIFISTIIASIVEIIFIR